jgi:hypothetical protein
VSRRWPPNVILLVVVAAGYAGTQFAVGMHRVFLGWDEIVYVSQFSRTVPAGFMDASRGWGVPLLVAPVAALTTSVEAIRGYLLVLLAVGVCCAYLPWLRLRDSPAVPCAVLLLCGLWVAVFYGNAAMPNMLTALCAVAAVALFLQVTRAGSARPVMGLTVAAGVLSLTRPLDTVWLALPLLAACCLHGPWRRPAAALAVVAGVAIGWIPWVIEAHVRFGGLLPRLAELDLWHGGDLHVRLLRHLQSFSSGTIQCAAAEQSCGPISLPAVFAWCALAALAALGLTAVRGTPHMAAMVLTVIVAAANVVAQVSFSGQADPRSLLPTYALLVLPAAEGLHWLARRRHRATRILAPATVLLVVGSQLTLAGGLAADTRKARHQQVRQARAVIRLGVRPPCLIYGSNAPQIAYLARCRYQRRYQGTPERGFRVVVVTRGTRAPAVPAEWRHLRLLPGRSWHAHLPPEG